MPDFLLRTWDSEDGLPGTSLRSIVRTPDGYVWIATGSGLARFDGVRFIIITTNQAPQLGDNRISCLLVDRSGELWVGTEGGTMARRQQGQFVPVSLDSRMTQLTIKAMARGREGGLWLATSGAGLVHWANGVCDYGALTNGLPETNVWDVAADPQGNVWARARDVLATFRSNQWQTVALPKEAGSLAAMAPARHGGVYVATVFVAPREGCGGKVFHVQQGEVPLEQPSFPWRKGAPAPRLEALLEDSSGGLWLGTGGVGLLHRERDSEWQALLLEGIPHQPTVNCLAKDETGALWVGFGRSDQLAQIRPRLVKTLNLPKQWEQSRIYAVCAAHDGSIWVGTSDAGVFRFHDGQCEHFGPEQGLDGPRVSVILEDKCTNLWVGTLGGLFRFNDKRFEATKRGNIISLYEERRGHLWAGTLTNLMSFSPTRAGRGSEEKTAALSGPVMALTEDREGRLWAGTIRRGLFYLADGQFRLYQTTNQALQNADVRALVADRQGSLWIASLDSGLFRVREGTVSHWSVADGLPSDRFHGLIEDARGNLWFSSDNGLFGCSPAQFDKYIPGQSPPMVFWHLSTEDGLASKLGSRAGWPSVARSADGRLWFPNQSAVAVFDPQKLDIQSSGAVLIEEVLVNGIDVRTNRLAPIRVKSSARQFEFHYTCASLQAPDRIQFRYRLQGWDTEWVNVGRRRVAYYGQLPPGQYRFQVMAAEPGGQWREAQSALQLEIIPTLWERRSVQASALLLLLASAGGTAWTVARVRSRRRLALVEQQRALERERRRIAQDIHDDLGGSLTQISLCGELLRQDLAEPARAAEHVDSIGSTVRYITKSLDEIVWAVNPHNDTLPHLIDYIGQFAVGFLRSAGLRCLTELPEDPPERVVSSAVRHNLFLAVKEALHNVVRHAHATQVWLSLCLTEEALLLTIEDNGKGFASEPKQAGADGLRNLRGRMTEIGGECRVTSQVGKGTRVELEGPWVSKM